MRRPDLAKAFQAFSSVMSEKKSISAKECMTVEKLNRALSLIGYRIRPINPIPHTKQRGRHIGPRNKNHGLRIVHRNNAHNIAKRRPGRPKLRRVV